MTTCWFFVAEEEKYFLKDENGEKEVGCDLQESLRRARSSPIFKVCKMIFGVCDIEPGDMGGILIVRNMRKKEKKKF